MAIITRWRMPPESWCGYSRARCAGSGMRTQPQHLDRLAATAASRDRSWCSRIASAIWSPMVSTGLSEVIGSWKIIDDLVAADVAHRRFVELQQVAARRA